MLVVLAVTAIALIARQLTGSYLPSDAEQSLIFQNALLLVVLGSTVAERRFTKPSESLINALMGVVTLLGVYNASPRAAWFVVFAYCATVFLLAALCVGVSTGEAMGTAQRAIARVVYRPVVILGRARLLYSVLFFLGYSPTTRFRVRRPLR